MRAIVIAGGEIHEPAFYKPLVWENDLILCADRGYLACKAMGLVPDLIIGDFDSGSREGVPEGVPVLELPVEKDETDLAACLLYAMDGGAEEILVFGSQGGRLDHSLAAISLVYKGLLRGVKIRLIDEKNELFMFRGEVTIPKKEGYKLSLLPLENAEGIFARGVYYPINGGKMEWGDPYGVSNEFTADEATIQVEKGVLMAILSRD